jgi:hypothetical protein
MRAIQPFKPGYADGHLVIRPPIGAYFRQKRRPVVTIAFVAPDARTARISETRQPLP